MKEFYNSTGEQIILSRQIGRGGEGTVFEVADKPELVAKIYHEPISDEKAEKLRQMVALGSEKLLRLAAWCVDVLHDENNGRVVGFLMPKLNFGQAIHELYNPKSRRQTFPEADWRFLIHTAANLARAFSVVHSHGHVVGDVNHGNVLIARDATVRLIDCDSYHLNAPEKSFLCEVGVSTHTPPELQGKTLREVHRTANHDAFGLAVLIFQLLFMGRHPFSGAFLGEGENTLENSILHQRFAYGEDAKSRLMRQPPGTLPLSALTPQVAALFERAFLQTENRPTAREWIDTLEDLAQNLSHCRLNNSHYFVQTLAKCPWCQLESETGVLFFPMRFTGNFEVNGEFDLMTIERLLNTFKPPESPKSLPSTAIASLAPAAKLPPSLNTQKIVKKQKDTLVLICIFLAIGAFLVGFAFGWSVLFWGMIVGYWIIKSIIEWYIKSEVEVAQLNFDEARLRWNKVKEEWDSLTIVQSFELVRSSLRDTIKKYRDLPHLLETKVNEAANEELNFKLYIYLKGFPINKSGIMGLEGDRWETLKINGIKTAYDVTAQNFQNIGYFSYSLKQKLFEWREELVKNFAAKNSFTKNEIVKNIEDKIKNERQSLEKILREGFIKLQSISTQTKKRIHDLTGEADQFAAQLTQAESDLKWLKELKTLAISWAIGVSVCSVFTGVLTRQILFYDNSDNYSESSVKSGRGNGYGAGTSNIKAVKMEEPPTPKPTPGVLGTPKPKINRSPQTAELFQKGANALNKGDYEGAKIALEQAAKLQPKDVEILQVLGETERVLGWNKDAVATYQKILKISPNDTEALYSLGIVYNRMERYAEAITVLKKAIEIDSNPPLPYYELGVALRNSNQPKEALKYLKIAAEKIPIDLAIKNEIDLCNSLITKNN